MYVAQKRLRVQQNLTETSSAGYLSSVNQIVSFLTGWKHPLSYFTYSNTTAWYNKCIWCPMGVTVGLLSVCQGHFCLYVSLETNPAAME